jgi:hypothetical protein
MFTTSTALPGNLRRRNRCTIALDGLIWGFLMRVEHIFISPGHNFFGHHGQPAGEHGIIAVEHIECVAGRGIRGDRFFHFKDNYKGQITFFSMEVFEGLRRELNLPHAQPQATRRNVFVRGADLNELIGKQFSVQGVSFEGIEECRPCYWMNSALGPGVEEWLRGRAGLRCRILTDGTIYGQKDFRPVAAHFSAPATEFA